MAVSPLLSTALMSAPRSNAACMASNTSLSVPASSPGERVPSPAAAISGVELSSFVSSGSAPSAASVRISSASAVLAARKKGVAPRVFRLVSPRFTFFVMRVFKFAPRAASFLTSSMLVIVPDPCGAGLLSPPPGLRTLVITCRAVKPATAAFGSAPASSRVAASW